MKLAIVGATGLVGREMLQVLAEQAFPVTTLIPAASPASAGQRIAFGGKDWEVVTVEAALAMRPDVALFSAGSAVSKVWAPQFAAAGTLTIDNSSHWRMDPAVPLVVPEVNLEAAHGARLIANPNCNALPIAVALWPLHQAYGIQRIVVSTYQSVTGTGKAAVEQLMAERAGSSEVKKIYPHAIDLNVIPQVDAFTENGYTKEENKIVDELRKIMGAPGLRITATCVRIPVIGGHSESVNVQFEKAYDLHDVRRILAEAEGVVLLDEPHKSIYPMPKISHGRDEVFVGRVRRDDSAENALNLWIVADNLRKGAATNAVQIAQALLPQLVLR